MGADLPPGGGELAQLVPGHAAQLTLVRGAAPIPRGQRHRLLRSHPVRRSEDGGVHAQRVEDRPASLVHRAVRVVERHRERAAVWRREHRLRERGGPVALAQQVRQLPLEGLGRYAAVLGPARADGVVAQDERLAAVARGS